MACEPWRIEAKPPHAGHIQSEHSLNIFFSRKRNHEFKINMQCSNGTNYTLERKDRIEYLDVILFHERLETLE